MYEAGFLGESRSEVLTGNHWCLGMFLKAGGGHPRRRCRKGREGPWHQAISLSTAQLAGDPSLSFQNLECLPSPRVPGLLSSVTYLMTTVLHSPAAGDSKRNELKHWTLCHASPEPAFSTTSLFRLMSRFRKYMYTYHHCQHLTALYSDQRDS